MTPFYWLFVMSFKTTRKIEASFIPYPQAPTLENFELIFSDHTWYLGYLNAVIYVLINVTISLGRRHAPARRRWRAGADSRPRAHRLHEEPPGARVLDGASRVVAPRGCRCYDPRAKMIVGCPL